MNQTMLQRFRDLGAIASISALLCGILLLPAGTQAEIRTQPAHDNIIRINTSGQTSLPVRRYSTILVVDRRPEVMSGREAPGWVGYAFDENLDILRMTTPPGTSFAQTLQDALRSMAGLDSLAQPPTGEAEDSLRVFHGNDAAAIIVIRKFRMTSREGLQLEYDFALAEADARGDTLLRDSLAGRMISLESSADQESWLAGKVIRAVSAIIMCQDGNPYLACSEIEAKRADSMTIEDNFEDQNRDVFSDIAHTALTGAGGIAAVAGIFFLGFKLGFLSMPALH